MDENIRELIRETTKEVWELAMKELEVTKKEPDRNYFKDTEKLLYTFNTLKEHVEDEQGYFNMLQKRSGCSFIKYEKNKSRSNENDILRSRAESLQRSKSRVSQIEKAIDTMKQRKEYRVLQLFYFEKNENGEKYSAEEIVNILKNEGIQISERTAARWKNLLVSELSIRLFGADAL